MGFETKSQKQRIEEAEPIQENANTCEGRATWYEGRAPWYWGYATCRFAVLICALPMIVAAVLAVAAGSIAGAIAAGSNNRSSGEAGFSSAASCGARLDYSDLVVLDTLRTNLANVSLDMMLEPKSFLMSQSRVNLSLSCDIFDDALHMVGLRGVLTSLMEIHHFKAAFDKIVRSRSVPIKTTLEDTPPSDFTILYDADFISDPKSGFGSLYALRHWLGQLLADKILEGPISLHGQVHGHCGGYVNTSAELVHEVMHLMEAPGAYEQNVHSSMHGIVWHLLSHFGPLEKYPLDTARTWCKVVKRHYLRKDYADGMYGDTPTRQSMVQNCVHAVGHAAFFNLAYRDLEVNVSARTPLYPPAFTMSNASKASAHQICDTAPTEKIIESFGGWYSERVVCDGGLHHSLMIR